MGIGLHRRVAAWLGKRAAEDRNSFTITTIAPAQAGRAFQVELPRWSVRLAGAVLISGIVLMAAGGILYGKLIRDALLLRDVRAENMQLRERVDRLEEIEKQLAQLDQVRRQLYALAGVPEAGGSGDAVVAPIDSPEEISILVEPALISDSGDLPKPLESSPLKDLPYHGPVSRGFTAGQNRNPEHSGVDIAGPVGAPVASAGDGVVVFAGWDKTFGNLLVISHEDTWETRYGHSEELLVEVGESVRAGQTIALIGSTGTSSAPHLHFEMIHEGRSVDPGDYFAGLRGAHSNSSR